MRCWKRKDDKDTTDHSGTSEKKAKELNRLWKLFASQRSFLVLLITEAEQDHDGVADQ